MPNKHISLGMKEFYDVYAISLVHKSASKFDLKFMCSVIDDIAQKYVKITLDAVRCELRHAKRGGVSYYYGHENDLKKFGIKGNVRLKKTRAKIDFSMAKNLFREISWEMCYGGNAWAAIADAGDKLQALLPTNEKNIGKIISAIDYLNDLEHNTRLYLASYATFNLENALDFKLDSTPPEVINKASPAIKYICKNYRASYRR